MPLSYILIHVTLLAQLIISTKAHSRWKCPEPRSSSTGIKSGPCGEETGDFSGTPLDIKPGPLTVIFEESITHTGAPFRISLSADGNDDHGNVCVLLDHIPHNDDASPRPRLGVPSTYTPYVITVDIPDVSCERCSLHLSNPMTDKIGADGSPSGSGCTDPDGSCRSVYHSCTRPLRIVGTTPRSEFQCSSPMPPDWPVEWTGDAGETVDASTPGLYRRESSVWGAEDHKLEGAPSRFRHSGGGLCVESGVSGDSSNGGTEFSPSPSKERGIMDQPPTLAPLLPQSSTNGADVEEDTSVFSPGLPTVSPSFRIVAEGTNLAPSASPLQPSSASIRAAPSILAFTFAFFFTRRTLLILMQKGK